MFHRRSTQKKLMAQPPKGLGLKLAQSKDKESYCSHNSCNIQFELEAPTCQFQHGLHLVYAGSAANLLKVGYLLHAVAWRGSWLTANSLEHRLRFWAACPASRRRSSPWLRWQGLTSTSPISRVVARQLGLLAQVRCPARGSARVASLKHNV